MSDIEGSLGARPLPELDNVSRPFWEAAARGEVLYQECPECGHRQLYPRALCTACAAEPEWRQAAGTGTVHTYTVIHQNWAAPFKELSPYVVAVVELDEGPRLMTNIIDCDPSEVSIGLRVEARTFPVEDLGLVFFRPARAPG